MCILGKKRISISRKQSLTVLSGMLVATLYSLLKVLMGDSFAQLVPISGIFALSALFMLLGIYRYDLLKIAPLAREQVFHFLGDGIVIAVDVPQWYEALRQGREGQFSFCRAEIFCDCSVYAIKTGHGTISLLKDSTEQKRRNDLLQVRAERDGLTGIYNRQTLIEKVEKRLLEKGGLTTLVFFDIDNFKLINDRYGHMAGDQLLQAVVACVSKAMVGTDLMGRMGGEEFAIFHASESKEETLAWAEDLRGQVADTVITIEGNPVSCTISLGLCFSRTENFDAIYRCADRVLYKAKDSGRNCICHTFLG